MVLRTQHDMIGANQRTNAHTRRVNALVHAVGNAAGAQVFPWDAIFNEKLQVRLSLT